MVVLGRDIHGTCLAFFHAGNACHSHETRSWSTMWTQVEREAWNQTYQGRQSVAVWHVYLAKADGHGKTKAVVSVASHSTAFACSRLQIQRRSSFLVIHVSLGQRFGSLFYLGPVYCSNDWFSPLTDVPALAIYTP